MRRIHAGPIAALALLAACLVNVAWLNPSQAAGGAVFDSADCRSNAIPANDDGSSEVVTLPFTLNFFGVAYDKLWVNNNGNVTFTQPMGTYTPFTINADTPPIIAPFFADVDTRGTGSVTYGTTTFQGFPTFCVNWTGVGYFDQGTDLTNTFQLLLVSRTDVGRNAFDVVFNYDRIQWETGSASGGGGGKGGTSAGVGYSNGDGNGLHFYELNGSLTPGSFLDDNSNGLVRHSVGGDVLGRYDFHIRTSSDPGGDISLLKRDFPYDKVGYNFGNPGLRTWRNAAHLGIGDVLTHDDMARTFSDWDTVTQGHFLWWSYSRDSHFFDALSDVMNHGMCFGLALTGGRFDAGLESLSNRAKGRSDGAWSRSNAFLLPQPGARGTTRTYNSEYLRMVADTFVTQFSTQINATLSAQHDAFADATSGFSAFKNQLISVMRDGKNLYDTSRKTLTASGNRYAGITLQVEGWGGHEVLAYSLEVTPGGSLKIGVWDNNFPNAPKTITVSPDGSWTYDAIYPTVFPSTTLSMRSDTSLRQGNLAVLPLYNPTGFNYYPHGPGTNATSGTGALVDVPAGVSASAVDASGRPVSREVVIANGGVDAGAILNLTSGTGSITVTGPGAALDVRSAGTFLAAGSTGPAPLTVSTTQGSGSIQVLSGRANLTAARGTVLAVSSGASALRVLPTGQVAVTGTGARARLAVTGLIDGQAATATLINATIPSGGLRTYTRTQVRNALIRTMKAQKLMVLAPRTVRIRVKFIVQGTVNTDGGNVVLFQQARLHGSATWVKLGSAKVIRKSFTFTLARPKAGTYVFQVRRASRPGYLAALSRQFSVGVHR